MGNLSQLHRDTNSWIAPPTILKGLVGSMVNLNIMAYCRRLRSCIKRQMLKDGLVFHYTCG